DVQHVHLASEDSIEFSESLEIWLPKTSQFHTRPSHPVIPPERNRVSLHHLQKSLQCGFFQVGSCSVSIGVWAAEIVLRCERITEVARCRGRVLEPFISERPHRCPFNLSFLV